ncbi:TetR family transcriptional regulator [Halostagnicola larsenii XH-48]|uniref:TetR family transcriptional regulator n=1 Tax=Halostagnicola larsenii XH-48 TaxID=797299 RepID=W0JSH9_9EURY|nr:TetR/AcrR family transcriptional regulator [Halostagnicola larsenii]AHG00165.1 TetR family transcriptional regulator [Halostagnicola larsenii XH-48]
MTDPDVRDAIMAATYDALCTHGYTDLTAQDIADRTDKSKSLLFYHYDSKEDLVADFIDYLLERHDERVEATSGNPPVERLATFLEFFLYGPDDDDWTSFHTAMLELRAQAPYNDTYREQFQKSDERLQTTLENILIDGIESGAFVEHDVEAVATLLVTIFNGARIREITLEGDSYLEMVRTAAVEKIIDDVLADGVELPTTVDIDDPLEPDERLETSTDRRTEATNGLADEHDTDPRDSESTRSANATDDENDEHSQ